jgi:hypothetical protein
MQIISFRNWLEGLIMARNAALPILTAEPGLTHYLEEIRRFPMLERQEEYMLAKRWRASTAIAMRRTSWSPAICGS